MKILETLKWQVKKIDFKELKDVLKGENSLSRVRKVEINEDTNMINDKWKHRLWRDNKEIIYS